MLPRGSSLPNLYMGQSHGHLQMNMPPNPLYSLPCNPAPSPSASNLVKSTVYHGHTRYLAIRMRLPLSKHIQTILKFPAVLKPISLEPHCHFNSLGSNPPSGFCNSLLTPLLSLPNYSPQCHKEIFLRHKYDSISSYVRFFKKPQFLSMA